MNTNYKYAMILIIGLSVLTTPIKSTEEEVDYNDLVTWLGRSQKDIDPLWADISNVTDDCTKTVFQILSGNFTGVNPNVLLDSG